MASPLVSSLRSHRARLDWSQAELAERVGVSRQAIVAIEAHRQVPSTDLALRLARVLGVTVEDLFELDEPEAIALHQTPEVPLSGRVHLGLVDQRWVAFRTETSEETCDGFVSTDGTAAQVLVRPLVPLEDLSRQVLVAGCAPLLGMIGRAVARHSKGRATWLSTTSTRALRLLAQGRVHIAGVHLVDAAAPAGHVPIIREMFSDQSMAVVNLTRFRQGMFVAPGNPKGIVSAVDFLRSDVRSALRLPGSGAQILTEKKLAEALICAELPKGPIARTHEELASWVREGLVDVGVGMEPVAIREGLDFVPLVEERFDLVLPKHRLSEPHIGRFLAHIDARSFRTEVAYLPGYDMGIAGHATTIDL